MPEVPVDGYAFGSLSMACYTVGCAGPDEGSRLPGTAPLGSDAPPEDTNIYRSQSGPFGALPGNARAAPAAGEDARERRSWAIVRRGSPPSNRLLAPWGPRTGTPQPKAR